jgi:hypothetical protein
MIIAVSAASATWCRCRRSEAESRSWWNAPALKGSEVSGRWEDEWKVGEGRGTRRYERREKGRIERRASPWERCGRLTERTRMVCCLIIASSLCLDKSEAALLSGNPENLRCCVCRDSPPPPLMTLLYLAFPISTSFISVITPTILMISH